MMYKYIVSILTLFIIIDGYCQDSTRTTKVPYYPDGNINFKTVGNLDKNFPEFSVKYNGKVITNRTLLGKKVVINFWFQSCVPCVAEFKPLNEMYLKLRQKKGVVFLTFTFENEEEIKKIRKKYAITYPVISISRKECYRLNQQNGFPTTFVIDKLGQISYMKAGGYDEEKKAREYIFKVLYPEIRK